MLRLCLRFVAVLVFYAALYALFLPLGNTFLQSEQNQRLYSQEGYRLRTLLQNENSAWQTPVPLLEFPSALLQMLIAEEDAHFYWHSGIDITAIARAAYQNIRQRKIVSGASTISMQLARVLFNVSAEENNLFKKNIWSEKLLQIYRALRLENNFTKQELLQAYVNLVPMPHNSRGLAFFSSQILQKDIRLLSGMEMSFVVSLIQEHRPQQKKFYQRVRRIFLRQYPLALWDDDEFFSLWQVLQKGGHSPLLSHEDLARPWRSPHFISWLQQQRLQQESQTRMFISSQWSADFNDIIKTELNFIKKYKTSHAAVVVLEKGKIRNQKVWFLRVMLGSQDFNAAEGENNGAYRMRQAGSTLKPLLYALAFEKSFLRPWHWIDDKQKSFYTQKFSMDVYHPKNYDLNYWGNIRVREALATSRNIPAVDVLTRLGVDDFFDFLQKAQVGEYTHTAEHYGPGLALGNGGATLLGLTRAYGILAAQGKLLPIAYALAKDESQKSQKQKNNFYRVHLWGESSQGAQSSENLDTKILSRETALMVSDILADASLREKGFGKRSFLDFPYKVAVKTGTSKDYRDAWTVGYSDHYVVGVWVGNFSGEKMNRISGAFGAGRIFHQIFRYLQSQNYDSLTLPQDIGWPQIKMCRIKNVVECEQTNTHESFYVPPLEWQELTNTSGRRKALTDEFINAQNTQEQYKDKTNQDYRNYREAVFYSPLAGEQFLLDPHIPLQVQKIPLRLQLPNLNDCRYKIFLDGEEKFIITSIASLEYKNVLPLQKGIHSLELYCNNRAIKKVFYRVNL